MNPYRRNSYRLPGHDYSDSSYAYFVTLKAKIRCITPDSSIDVYAPFTSCSALGQQANDSLHFYRERGKLLIYAYCIMPDHAHLLASPLDGNNLSTVLGSYQSFITRTAWQHGVVGGFWQRSYYDHIVRQQRYAEPIIRYILNNPVKARLVGSWNEWPWSGSPDLSWNLQALNEVG